jgi:hypothetical protein
MNEYDILDPLFSREHYSQRGELLIDRAIHRLETEGIALESEDGFNLFDSNGAIKERANGRVKLQSRALRRVMAKLPAAFNLFDQTGRKVATLTGGLDGGGGAALHGFCTAAPAQPAELPKTLEMIDQASAKMADQQRFDLVAASGETDFTLFYAAYKAVKGTRRPVLIRLNNAEGFDGIRNLLCVVAGSAELMERKPIAVAEVHLPDAGVWDDGTFRIICDSARLGIPVALVTEPAAATAEALISATAATLTALLYHQYAFISAPLIWGVPFSPPAGDNGHWVWDLLMAAGRALSLPMLATYPSVGAVFASGDGPLLAMQAAKSGAGIIAWGGGDESGRRSSDQIEEHSVLLPSITGCCTAIGDGNSNRRASFDSEGISAETEQELDAVVTREAARRNIKLPE